MIYGGLSAYLDSTPPRITGNWLSIRFRPIWKHLRSIFTTAQRPKDSAPRVAAVSNQKTNIIMVALVPNLSIRHVTVNTSYGYGYGYRVCQSAKQTEKKLKCISRLRGRIQRMKEPESPFPRSPKPAKQNRLSRFQSSGRTPAENLSYHALSRTLRALSLAFRESWID